jgi:Fic family protein
MNIKNDNDMLTKLSSANNKEKLILLLKDEYGYQLSKEDLSIVLGISTQTIDRRIKEGLNIPEYTRSGKGSKASYLFPITSVADYLVNTIKVH